MSDHERELDAIREHFAALAREQVAWTPQALEDLERALDMVPQVSSAARRAPADSQAPKGRRQVHRRL